MGPAPPPSRSAGKSAALAVGLGVGFAAMTGVVVGALYGANALSTTAASRQASKPALQEEDLVRDEEGRILNWKSALRIIQHGGIAPALRARLWPILLGVFDPGSTTAERRAEAARLDGVYRHLLGICAELESAAAAARREGGADGAAGAFSDAHRIIVMDALRTDLREEPATGSQDDTEGLSVVAVRLEGSDSEIMLVERDGDRAMEECVGDPSGEKDGAVDGVARDAGALNGHIDAAEHETQGADRSGDADGADRSDDADGADRSTAGGADHCENPDPDTTAAAAVLKTAATSPLPEASDASWTSAAAREAALGVPGGPAAAARMRSLVRLLSAYAVHDPDIGYCQGMSDLAAAALRVVPGETLAFACFERIMRAARRNFRHDEAGIRHQLGQLSLILADTDPRLYARLRELDSGDCMFAYRMVVVLLRRELTLRQALLVWEAGWAHAAAAGVPDGVPLAAGGLRRKGSPGAPRPVDADREVLPVADPSPGPDGSGAVDDGGGSPAEPCTEEAAAVAAGVKSASASDDHAATSSGSSADAVLEASASTLSTTKPPPSASATLGQQHATPDFVLQFIAAVVRGQRRLILGACRDADDVLRLFSGVRIDFWLTMALAQKQYKAYRSGPTSLMPAAL